MMHHRLTQSKTPTDDERTQALKIIVDGSKTLLEKGQAQAGTALAMLATKHYVDYKVPVSDASVGELRTINDCYVKSATDLSGEACRERLRFLKTAVAWSNRKDVGGYQHGHDGLNGIAAHAAARAGDFELAQRLFVHSDDPEGAARVLAKFATEHTLKSEVALVLTRAVLRYLTSDNLADAIVMRRVFADVVGWGSVEGGASAHTVPPLGNFCELLVKVCALDEKAAPLFQRLCQSYQGELVRDKHFAQQLTGIGETYFRIQPPQPSGLAGMMGSMLRGMMNT